MDPINVPAERAGRATAVVVGLLSLAAATGLSFFAGCFLVDDAFISFRYAHNLAQGLGLVYNAGERLEGYTNFLWVLLLAGAETLGLPIPGTAAVLGFLLGLAGLAAAWVLARQVLGTEDPLRSLLPVLALALNRSYWFWAVSGMENALFAALVTLGAALLLAAPRGGRRTLLVGSAVLALAALARPEAPLVIVLVVAVLAVPPRAALRPRDGALALLAFAVPLALYAAWKLWYFGSLLPNTFYAKSVGAAALAHPGRRYVLAFLADYGFGLGAAALLAAPLLSAPGRRRAAALPAVVTAGYLAYLWAVGGDIYYHYRFVTPVLPLLCVGVAAAVFAAIDRIGPRGRRLPAAAAAIALLGFSCLAGLATERRYRQALVRDRDLNDFRERVSAWLGARPPETVIATISAGIIPYRTNLRTIDLAGLTHREIGRSRLGTAAPGPLAHQKSSAEAVLRERPDLIEFRHYRSTGDLAPSGQPEYLDFAELYIPFFQSPPRYPAWRDLALREDFHRSYRLALFPLGGTSGIATFVRQPEGRIPAPEALANYGWALQAEGRGREGVEYLLRALREMPGDAQILRRLESLVADPPPDIEAVEIRAGMLQAGWSAR